MPAFFGWKPTDWHEAMDGHRFSLALEREPDEAALQRLAAHVDRSWDKGGADLRGPYLFSGRVFAFRARGWGVTHLPRVRRWIQQLHAELPISDAVFHDIREGGDFPGEPVAAAPNDWRGRPADESLPPFAPHAVFDTELARLSKIRTEQYESRRDRAAHAKLDKALGKQRSDAAVRFERIHGEVQPAAWDEGLCAAFEVPDPLVVRPPGVPETSSHRVPAPGDHPIPHPRRALARVVGDVAKLAYLDESGTRREVRLPGTAHVSLRADGARAVAGSDLAVVVVDFEAHTTRWLPRPDPHARLAGVAYLTDDRVAILTHAGLYVVDEEDRVVARQAIKKPARLVQVADGHGVGVLDDQVRIFSAAGGKLKSVASLSMRADAVEAQGDELQLETRGGNLRVVGLETLRAPPKKAKPKELDVPLARFRILDEAPARPVPPPAGPKRKDWTWQFTRADGVDVGQGFGQVMWQAPGGADGQWTGPRMTIGSGSFERALYLHGPDLLLLFDSRGARVLTCTATPPAGEIRELAGISFPIDDAYDFEGAVILTGPWGVVRVDGLAEAIRG